MPNNFSFRAAVLEQQNQPFAIRELTCPETLDIGQVLVHIKYSGICGAQLGEQDGIKGPDKYLPHTVGHEGGGVVVETGPGVRHVKVGDSVVIHWRKGIGIDSNFPKYWCQELDRFVGSGMNNTWQEFSVISENRLTKIPASIGLDQAALLGCAVTTGLGLIANEARVKPGQSVVVLGCGGVGLNLIQGAALASAYPIIGIDLYTDKLERAMQFGATRVGRNAQFVEGAINADFVIDTTGNAEVMKTAWEIAGPNGKVFFVAQLKHDKFLPLQTLAMHTGKTIHGSDGGGTDPTIDIPRYIKLIQAGKLNLPGLITHRCSLDTLNDTLRLIRAGEVSRALIELG